MAEFSELHSDIQVEARSCSVGLINRTLRWTLQDFCQKTHYWQHAIEPITLLSFNEQAPGTYIYPISLPAGSRMMAVRDFVLDGRSLLERSPGWLEEHYPSWRTATGDPQYFLMMSDRQVRFVPASDEVKPIAVSGRVILEPDKDGTTFSDELMRYQEGVVCGVLSRLLSMKGKPWTDGPRATVCMGTFQMAISDAKQEAMRDWNYGPITTEKVAWV